MKYVDVPSRIVFIQVLFNQKPFERGKKKTRRNLGIREHEKRPRLSLKLNEPFDENVTF